MPMPEDTLLAKNPDLPDTDPVSARVIAGALENVTLEMGHNLTRMAYSSIIRESEDFGAAICDSLCGQMAECPISTPLQCGPIPGYLEGLIGYMQERGDEFLPGDVFLHNHAYYGASHGPDIAVGVPVFYGDELVGYSVTTAHHLDIGAHTPGSSGIIDAIDAYAEGLQFIGIKLYEAGRRNEDVFRILEQNVRSPQMVVGDLEAQVATARIGAKRYLELIDRFGYRNLLSASKYMEEYSERMMRRAIARLPSGKYSADGFMDGYQPSDDPNEKDLRIAVEVTVEGDNLIVDLSGTSPYVRNRPFNMPFRGTVDIATYVTLRSILLDEALMPRVPQNAGLIRPIKIIAPKGCLANPIYPAPTMARFCGANVLADVLMRALAPIAPKNISAGTGNVKVAAYSWTDGNDYNVYMDITEGSYGGRFGKDGIDAVDTLFTNTRNNPIEDLESHYPLRVTRYELVQDKGGPGKWRGGLGSIRDVQLLSEVGVSVEGDGNVYAPWGIFGGKAGEVGALSFIRAGASEIVDLPAELAHRVGKAGDIYRTVGPCGGGYGDPLERDPNAVLEDVLDEYVTIEGALSDYGVVVDRASLSVDWEATESAREELRVGGE